MSIPAIRLLFPQEHPIPLDLATARFNVLDQFAMRVVLQYRSFLERDVNSNVGDDTASLRRDAYAFPQRVTQVHRITYRSRLEIVLSAAEATAPLFAFLRGLRDLRARFQAHHPLADYNVAASLTAVRFEELREMAGRHALEYLAAEGLSPMMRLFHDMDEAGLRRTVTVAPSAVDHITLPTDDARGRVKVWSSTPMCSAP